jgi:hypothetical protein
MDRKKNIFDRIGSLIPGYRGYAERDSRRNCDKQIRESVYVELMLIEKIVTKKILDAIKEKDKDLMRQLESKRKDLNTLSSKIKYAPYGESSFFSDKQIKEDELLEIYKFDLLILETVEDFKEIEEISLNAIDIFNVKLSELLDRRNAFIGEHR